MPKLPKMTLIELLVLVAIGVVLLFILGLGALVTICSLMLLLG